MTSCQKPFPLRVRESVALLALFLAVAMSSPVAAQIGTDIRLLPADAFAVAVLHPRRVLTSPEMQLLPLEVYSVQGRKELGFDPLDIERVVLFVQPPAEGPPGFGAIIRLQKPMDPQKLLPKILATRTPEKLRTGTVYHGENPVEPSVFLPNNQIIVVASRPSLDAMLQLRGAEGTLGKAIQNDPLAEDVSLVALVEPIRPLIQQALAEAPIPPPFAPFKEFPNLVDRVDFKQQWTNKAVTSLSFKAANPQKAQQLQEMIASAIELGKGALLQAASQEVQVDDPEVAEAMSTYLRRITEEYSKLLQPKAEGDRVSYKAEQASALSTTATVGVLTAILLPAVQRTRQAAHRVQGLNNVRQIGISFHAYHDVQNRFPAAAPLLPGDKGGKLSWRVHLLPYLEETALYEQFHLDEPWDSEHNKQLIAKMPKMFRSPTRREDDGKTTYVVVTGKDTMFFEPQGISFAQIVDGSSNTVMLLEVANDKAVIWTKPDDWPYDPKDPFRDLDFSKDGGVAILMADGSVRKLRKAPDPEMWRRLLLRNDGQAVNLP